MCAGDQKPIPSHTVIARKDLDADTEAKFVSAMLSLNQPENRHLLAHVYSPDGYIAADPAAAREYYQPLVEGVIADWASALEPIENESQ